MPYAVAVLCAFAWVFIFGPADLQGLFFRNMAQLIPLLVLAMMAPVALAKAFSTPTTFDEAFPHSPGRRYRLAWVTSWTMAACVVAALVTTLRTDDAHMVVTVVRNLLLGFGIVLTSGIVLPASASWLPVFVYGLVCWLIGIVEFSNEAEFWALPLHQLSSMPSWIGSIGLFLLGSALYVLRSSKPLASS